MYDGKVWYIAAQYRQRDLLREAQQAREADRARQVRQRKSSPSGETARWPVLLVGMLVAFLCRRIA